MSMSKKHFTAIASVFETEVKLWRCLQPNSPQNDTYRALLRVADDIAEVFQKENPLFERERFMRACGFMG